MSSNRSMQSEITTTNSYRNAGNDEAIAAPSKGAINRNPATITATIRTRSKPIKTQIAKLVYDPKTKTIQSALNENESPVTEPEMDNFQKKREDRDREVKEIQQMLNEITNSSQTKDDKQPETGESAITKNQSPKSIQRSKTEINLRPPNIRRSLVRTGGQTTRSKSVQSNGKENAPPKPRQKPYNPEEARRYMQEQKKKRKSLNINDDKPTVNKDEIKKRLENLRKNTRQIVNKNVKKAKKKAQTNSPGKGEDEFKVPSEVSRNVPTERRTDREQRFTTPSETTSIDPSPLSENYKKIGLLRKPEIKDHSFSAIKDLNMEKENLILEIPTPKLAPLSAPRLKQTVTTESSRKSGTIITKQQEKHFDSMPQQPKNTESIATGLKQTTIPELSLEIPQVQLKSHVSLREKSVQVDRSVQSTQKPQKKTTDIPFWLKPTAVQSYPYNFIMAVRKKLEAITNSPAVATSRDRQSTSKVAETPLTYPKSNRTNNVKRNILDNQSDADSKSPEHSAPIKDQINHKAADHQSSRTLSEITSNFSSISIQIPESNVISTKKSESLKPIIEARKSVRYDEDDTTVSSSVFSSPEKKKRSQNPPAQSIDVDESQLSPLSVENISNLHIKSKAMLKNVTLDRGDTFVRQKTESGAISSRSEASVDFNQLLDDFNRSLSQVIEVNQQLKTTLVKSHQIFSPEKKKSQSEGEEMSNSNRLPSAKSMEVTDYVSDFEESSNTEDRQKKDADTAQSNSSIPEVESDPEEPKSQHASSASSSTEEAFDEELPARSSAEQTESKNSSRTSLNVKTFVIPSEKPQQNESYSTQFHDGAIEESPNKENASVNQYSRDSLDMSSHEEYVKSHVNTTRGDFDDEKYERSVGPPPGYKSKFKESSLINSSYESSELLQVFNKSDLEISVLSLNRSHSESTINYSSIGLYEKLIQNETNKSEHLAALLKMREKVLLDRTKGQIAWLEVQKERYKAKGLTVQISAVKKKQRGILLKMEKEREEIKKLLQQARIQRDNKLRIPEIRPSSDVPFLHNTKSGIHNSAVLQTTTSLHKRYHNNRQQQQHHSSRPKSSTIVKGYELETSRSLEQLLLKREEDLRRRREHVERLMEWHRRLDQEEAEVLHLERMLLDYNNAHVQQQPQESVPEQDTIINRAKMEKKLKEINRSLRELNSIPAVDGSTDAGAVELDTVRTTGSKLNKLWRRLTSQRIEKFEPNKRYKLSKSDLEQLYEEAKLAVLREYGENVGQMEVFLGQSLIGTPQPSTIADDIPQLNLNFSSGQSDTEMVRGNYNPSAAEEEFLNFAVPSVSDGGSERDEGLSALKRAAGSSCSSFGLPSFAESGTASKLLERASFSGRSKYLKSDFDGKRASSASDSEQGATEQSVTDAKTLSSPTSVVETTSHSGKSQSEASGSSDAESPRDCSNTTENDQAEDCVMENQSEDDKVQSEQCKSPSLESVSAKNHTLSVNAESIRQDVPVSAASHTTSVPENLSESVSSISHNESTSVGEVDAISKPSENITANEVSSQPQSVEILSVGEKIISNAGSSSPAKTKYSTTPESESGSERTVSNSGVVASVIPDADHETETASVIQSASVSYATDKTNRSEDINESLTLTNKEESCGTQSNARSLPLLDIHPDEDLDPPSLPPSTNGQIDEFTSKNTTNDVSHEDNAALNSIRSTEHSTNSKHSVTQSNTASNDQPSIESETYHGATNNDIAQTYSSAFDCSATEKSTSVGSNQIRSSVIMSINPSQIESNAFYESDFNDSEETNIDDVSLPKFETTGEDEQLNESHLSSQNSATDLEKRLIDLDISLKDLDASFERALSPEKAYSPPRDDGAKRVQQQQQQVNASNNDNTLMPDIINEVELRRRQQAILESEMMQFEHAVPYMYMREIPNKPPPPYVPPAHGSPMTTIFPSEERIKDITYRRTKELYHDILNIDTTDENGKKPPSVLDENITNIYERIILDICKEYLTEYEAILTAADPNNFHSPLAFFNPPDRLKCMQDFIYKEVRKSLAMDKNTPKRNQIYSVYGHRGKRDHIGEIIIQEMYEEDDKWSNFYAEEAEVLELIIDEMIGGAVRDVATQVLDCEVPAETAQIPSNGST